VATVSLIKPLRQWHLLFK